MKPSISSIKRCVQKFGLLLVFAAQFLFFFGVPFAVAGQPSNAQPEEVTASPLASWWGGKTLTGNWGGFRDALQENAGLSFSGKYYGAFFGVVDSQNGSRGIWDQGVEFGAEQNIGRLMKMDGLKGVTLFGNFRYRDSQRSADPGTFVSSNSMFDPTNWYSGTQFRVTSLGVEIGSGDWMQVKDGVVLRGGWLQPQREFIDQPLSKLFLNNAVNSAKGVGGNIPFSSSFTTWGGTLKIKPKDWCYAKGGLFMAYPQATSSDNHGLAFQGFAPDVSLNGLMAMVETGVTPKIGPSQLEGKYAVGGYYWGQNRQSYNGTNGYGQQGVYIQGDQMLYRETAPMQEISAKSPSVSGGEGKGLKAVVPSFAQPLSKQGLSAFNLVSLAPAYNNLFPFYFQSGLVYTGLVPSRDKDIALFSVAYGSYSAQNIHRLQRQGQVNQPNYTMFLEGGYRIQINNWSFLQPFVQYEIRPAGTPSVKNAAILGFYTGLTF